MYKVLFTDISNPTFLKFINLSCCINQINEEKQRRKNYSNKKKLEKKISSPPNNKPKKRL